MTTLPPVSVIVPARNAEKTLPEALESILAQDYEAGFEVIVADGSDGGGTRELVRERFPDVRIVANPARSIPAGLNRALDAARHPVIARCDVRATLPPGYLTRAVSTLRRTGAANVGGRVRPSGSTFFERAVALTTSAPIGAGDARYRVGGPEGSVDTVFPGVFRRAALEAVGGWDESLLRNEDYELNWRLRENGGTVWFDPGLTASYRPRGSISTLARQYFDYGRWKRAVLARHPRSWRLRQLVPPLVLVALAASAALAAAAGAVLALAPAASAAGTAVLYAAAVCPLGYALLLLLGAAAIGLRRRRLEAGIVPIAAGTIHLAWAAGFLAGPPRGAAGG